eukprot:scaffold3826_cov407-Prasinococcus_capsulatus_cf.AAC.1
MAVNSSTGIFALRALAKLVTQCARLICIAFGVQQPASALLSGFARVLCRSPIAGSLNIEPKEAMLLPASVRRVQLGPLQPCVLGALGRHGRPKASVAAPRLNLNGPSTPRLSSGNVGPCRSCKEERSLFDTLPPVPIATRPCPRRCAHAIQMLLVQDGKRAAPPPSTRSDPEDKSRPAQSDRGTSRTSVGQMRRA